MQFQRTPLPPDVEYFLDCANECDEIGSFAHVVLTLLGNRKAVIAIIDREKPGRIMRNRQDKCHELDAYAHEIVADLPGHEQRAFAAAGLRWEPLRLLRIAEYLAHFNFEDQTRGGANLPFRRNWRCDKNYDPTPGARRHLYAPAAIRRFAKMEDCSMPRARLLASRLRHLPAAIPADLALVTDLANEQREAYKAEYHKARQQFMAGQRRRFFDGPDLDKSRRVIQRSARFCAGLLGSDKVSAFARGEAVPFPGRDVTIEVSRGRSIATVGHGALDVRLLSHDGTKLANVCIYFEAAPAFDQLAAVALHVGAGEEGDLISTGNLFNITDAGTAHPVVKSRLAKTPAETVEVMNRFLRHGRTQNEYDKQREALRRYTADTIEIYCEAVRTQVWGRDARRLDPFIDDLMESSVTDIREMRTAA